MWMTDIITLLRDLKTEHLQLRMDLTQVVSDTRTMLDQLVLHNENHRRDVHESVVKQSKPLYLRPDLSPSPTPIPSQFAEKNSDSAAVSNSHSKSLITPAALLELTEQSHTSSNIGAPKSSQKCNLPFAKIHQTNKVFSKKVTDSISTPPHSQEATMSEILGALSNDGDCIPQSKKHSTAVGGASSNCEPHNVWDEASTDGGESTECFADGILSQSSSHADMLNMFTDRF